MVADRVAAQVLGRQGGVCILNHLHDDICHCHGSWGERQCHPTLVSLLSGHAMSMGKSVCGECQSSRATCRLIMWLTELCCCFCLQLWWQAAQQKSAVEGLDAGQYCFESKQAVHRRLVGVSSPSGRPPRNREIVSCRACVSAEPMLGGNASQT